MGNEIRKIRAKFKLTQAELAEKLGVTQQRVAKMEKQKTVTLEMVRRISKALGVSVKELVNNEE